MPAFISDEEYAVILSTGDVSTVAEKADAFIQTLTTHLETTKAEADAAAITAEQTCSLLEQKYISLSSEFSALESRNSQLDSSLQEKSSQLAQIQSDKHQLHLKFIEKDGEIERLKTEISELQKSRRQLVELVGLKDTEISEKDSTFKSYLDKITNLSDGAAHREARLSELEAELVRCRANCDKLLQEKELIEKHNIWLNDELTTKVDSLYEQRRRTADIEGDLSSKLTDLEKQYNECSISLNRHKERARELESKVESLHLELCSARDDASATEQRYSAELSTVSKLAELYKESSEQWSKKAGDLEGVIKALETHKSQVESDYSDKLEQEVAARKEAETESLKLKEKLAKCEAELESNRRASEMEILPLSSFTTEAFMLTNGASDIGEANHAIVPHVPAGVSGTALAASLLREGWSLAKMYGKYQEAADAWRHEQMGRKQTEAILERVLLEIEEKASVILDERAEHERMADAYALMNQKLQQSLAEQASLEKLVRESEAKVKKHEREYNYAQKEITDLQRQVAILLKECRDVQLRCGSAPQDYMDDDVTAPTYIDDESDIQKVISEHLLSITDIRGLVEQNAKLRSLVRSLSDEVESREMQIQEQFKEELQKHKEEAASRVTAVLERAEEQGQMIESLHSSVSMYRRLYEEEQRLRSSQPQTTVASSGDGGKDFMLLLEGSQEATKRIQEQASERVRGLEDELASRKGEIIALRSERDKLALEANFAQEKLERFMKEFNHQVEELTGARARNISFSDQIIEYQKKVHDKDVRVLAAEDHSRKLEAELLVLRPERELLLNSEKRAQVEVQDLSQRVYRLQATLDTLQSTEQLREDARAADSRKQEEYIKQIEREWTEAKKELQEERAKAHSLSLDRECSVKDATRQVEEMANKLAAALQAVTAAEGRASAAEEKYSILESKLRSAEAKTGGPEIPSSLASGVAGDLKMANQEIERLKSEVLANKNHMLQYKSIAEVNEAALKQMEDAHESFKSEAQHLKDSLEAEIQSLRNRINDLETESSLKYNEAAAAATQKEEALASALAEINSLKEAAANKVSQFMAVEVQVSVLKEDLEKAHQRARAAQANYERQVILQSETIQELTKTSQALASVQEEASTLRRMVDSYKSENEELKSSWVTEKSWLEKSKNEADKKYEEVNEQNKILLRQLESVHIKVAEKDGAAIGLTTASTSADSQSEAGLHGVFGHLRRSREIAETEISLLKKEKLHLQVQLERALKVAEAAEASLTKERVTSRSLLSEDEFKALKLQVSEVNLLRESNMQLREENRHNFEECQKLREVAQNVRIEAEKLESTLKERELEVEALRKNVELQKKEKEHMARRISEMLETSKNVDLEDYDRLKSEVEELQASMRANEAVIDELRKLDSQKQELMAKLEQELANSRSELSERETRLSLYDGLKSDIGKFKREALLHKRKADSLYNDKESLLKEKESLLKERESLGKEKDSLSKEKEVLLREKEALSKEKQTILKQLEDLRVEKKPVVDTSIHPAVREKEKEKDARIQSLETALGKFREDIKKEKEKRQRVEKIVITKAQSVDLEKKKFIDEHERQKESMKKLLDELEKLKNSRDSLPEGTSVDQLLSGNNLDDRASEYLKAVDNFEKEARLVLNDVGNPGSAGNTSAVDTTPVMVSNIQGPPAEAPVTAPLTATIHPPAKSAKEREKKVAISKARKLVRPRLKMAEPQRDVEMSDADRSKNSGKPTSVEDIARHSTVAVPSESSLRKRPASPSPSELQDQYLQPGDSGSDFPEPSLKKPKGESLEEDVQAQVSALENVETIPTVEELLDAVADAPQGEVDETFDFGKDIESAEGQGKEPGESQQPIDAKTLDMQKDDTVDEEHAGNTSEAEVTLDEACDFQAEMDVQRPMIEAGDREEGEMPPEGPEFDVGDDAGNTGSQDAADVQPDHSNTASMSSPAQIDDDPSATTAPDANEATSPEILNANEQIEEGEVPDDVDISDKSNHGDDENAGDSTVESAVLRDDISNIGSGEEAAQSSHASRTINISQRARLRAAARLGRPSPTPSSTTPPAVRRGGPLTRNRGGRSNRGGRRQASGDQG